VWTKDLLEQTTLVAQTIIEKIMYSVLSSTKLIKMLISSSWIFTGTFKWNQLVELIS
jgi:hypothetical protein